jgi:CheY-like chemotaxis protein
MTKTRGPCFTSYVQQLEWHLLHTFGCAAGKASTTDVIKGLQAGSSDYITKPFQPQEVLARIETQLRLYMGDMAALQVCVGGVPAAQVTG